MKKILAFVLVCALALTMVGCGGEKNSGKVTLTIGIPNGDGMVPTEIVDSFKAAHPEYEVVVVDTPWSDFKTKLKLQVSAGNAPDVFITDSGYATTLGDMGAAVNLADKIEKDLNRDDYIAALDIIKDSEGGIYGVTHDLASIGVFYNKKIFDDNNIPYPTEDWTFEEMLEIAKKLTLDTNGDGKTDIYGLSTGANMTMGWLPFMLSEGGAPINGDGTKSLFNSKESVAGLTKYYNTVQVDKISPDATWTTSNGNYLQAFYSGKVAMMIGMWGNADAINKNMPEGFSYDAQVMPIGKNGKRPCVYVPNQWVIYSRADKQKQEAAWEWIKHFMSEESQNILAERYVSVGFPVRKSAFESIASKTSVPENKEAFYKYIDSDGVTLFECASWEEWKPKAEQAFMEMQEGVITPKEAAKRVDGVVSELLE